MKNGNKRIFSIIIELVVIVAVILVIFVGIAPRVIDKVETEREKKDCATIEMVADIIADNIELSDEGVVEYFTQGIVLDDVFSKEKELLDEYDRMLIEWFEEKPVLTSASARNIAKETAKICIKLVEGELMVYGAVSPDKEIIVTDNLGVEMVAYRMPGE